MDKRKILHLLNQYDRSKGLWRRWIWEHRAIKYIRTCLAAPLINEAALIHGIYSEKLVLGTASHGLVLGLLRMLVSLPALMHKELLQLHANKLWTEAKYWELKHKYLISSEQLYPIDKLLSSVYEALTVYEHKRGFFRRIVREHGVIIALKHVVQNNHDFTQLEFAVTRALCASMLYQDSASFIAVTPLWQRLFFLPTQHICRLQHILMLLQEQQLLTYENCRMIRQHDNILKLSEAIERLYNKKVFCKASWDVLKVHSAPIISAELIIVLQHWQVDKQLLLQKSEALQLILLNAIQYLDRMQLLTTKRILLLMQHFQPMWLAQIMHTLSQENLLTQINEDIISKHPALLELMTALDNLIACSLLTLESWQRINQHVSPMQVFKALYNASLIPIPANLVAASKQSTLAFFPALSSQSAEILLQQQPCAMQK